MVLGKLAIHMQKNGFELLPHTTYKNELKMDQRVQPNNLNYKTLKKIWACIFTTFDRAMFI